MQQSISYPTPERLMQTEPTTSRLRTVTVNRFLRRCACDCGFAIPRDPGVRYVVDFGGPRPYPAYLREHSPDYGTYQGGRARKSQEDFAAVPGFENGTESPRVRRDPRA